MKLYDLLDMEKLDAHRLNRMVSCQIHPTLPLRIYNYTQVAQFENKWGDGTIDYCRGLIVDNEDNIIARPFKKFHNLQTSNIPETWEENLPNRMPTITKKYDGSLGVYYSYEGYRGIATRGSFTSPQAQWATQWLDDILPQGFVDNSFGRSTPLFEIIYPENRIVVNYDFEGLVLIGIVNNETGAECDYDTLQAAGNYNGVRVTEKLDVPLEALKAANIENEEGYVLTYRNEFSPPLKVKVKMADYLRLHKIITGMNARSVWELLNTGKGTAGFEHTPEHFQKWLTSWSEKLNEDFNKRFVAARNAFANRPYRFVPDEEDRSYRAKFARYLDEFVPREHHGVLFGMLDGKDVASMIWKSIKPRGDDATFRTEGE